MSILWYFGSEPVFLPARTPPCLIYTYLVCPLLINHRSYLAMSNAATTAQGTNMYEQPTHKAKSVWGYGPGALEGQTKLSRQDFRLMITVTRKTAAKHLDLTQRLPDQDKMRVEAVFPKVLEICPFVKSYKDLWPVKSYLRFYLAGRSESTVKARRRAECAKQQKLKVNSCISRRIFVGRTPFRSLAMRRPHIQASKGKSQPGGQNVAPQHPVPVSSSSGVALTSPPSASTTSPLPSVLPLFSAADPVLAFLKSLANPLPSLLQVFLAEGVNTIHGLRAAAMMTGRREWLNTLVVSRKITHFQAHLIYDGLTKLAASSSGT
ncbi:hypothetical protein SCP_0406420 [Sparassis crispa]|uniref:Uncharacterized protein n=1 Tax=Sparassis crispa TaxID=139825 RepID=A0A401GJB7_9APHY|nr:hypothetical protein SCP_0406420 [Sparassis crispa]GBE82258.1 hypothetical protein SCP_0406420 [Sparassis crispa]